MRIRFFLLANLAALAAAAPITQDGLQPVPLLTTYGNPNSAMYLTDGLPRYAGVAQLIIESIEGVISCSGALLPSGIHVLTAAHCISDRSGVPSVLSLSAEFYPSGSNQPEVIEFAGVVPHPSFSGRLQEGSDIGLVVLKHAPSAAIPRYGIYTGSAEIGSEYEVVGFGQNGTGQIEGSDGRRRRGWNTFDSNMSATFEEFPGWTGGDGVLVSDFDNGLAANDALGFFYGINGIGLGAREASMAPGDSGAPAFIGDRIAGVASFRLRLNRTDGATSDIDDISNASFGEFNAFTRVSSYSDWLQPVPEPGTTRLFVSGCAFGAILWFRRRRTIH
jgi:secreted trypsin-like serine protease